MASTAAPVAALVTGASRGIGLALAQRLTAQGPVIGTCRRAPPAAEGIRWAEAEMTSPASIAALADQLEGAPLERLICNAGIYPDKGQSLEGGYPPEMWADSFAVNVTAAFLTVQALLPNLRAAQAPRIALISSQMASHTRAPGGSYIYRASKAAVLNLGRNLATDLRGDGIAVGIYHPGWVRTDMGGSAAEISVDEAANGLAARVEELSLATTGAFLTWDRREHAF
ncbi:SDR family NAD(P)-dependent oxidoreductase [Oceanicola sp. D3]|uniref:SDR family NAD(P)-dependent oxidoreductase n=1 Tax=Oceanicola sp. D3 TaxID=2587163 RepID=UPI00111E941C|nr:SDR family NAD(P)-dependent oxidoreductase [Oceanicola sp. D3]QDC10540.1 SDR family NAD(P)-dependent oxidoreductase [Oceanicola sp. D3]